MPDGTETESVDVRKSPPAISVTYNEKELSEKFLNVVSCNGNIHKNGCKAERTFLHDGNQSDKPSNVMPSKSHRSRRSKAASFRILFACVICNTLTAIHYAAFSIYYVVVTDYFNVNKATAGWVTSVGVCMSYFGGIFISPGISLWGCRWVGGMGGLVIFVSLVASAFVPDINILILTYGFFGGIGVSSATMCPMVEIQQHFKKNRPLAQGVSMLGFSVGNFLSSIIIANLVKSFGLRGALVIHGAIMFHIVPLSFLFRRHIKRASSSKNVEEQSPVKRKSEPVISSANKHNSVTKSLLVFARDMIDFSPLTDKIFVFYVLGCTLSRSSINVFLINVPSRAVSMGMSMASGAILLSLVSVGQFSFRLPTSILANFVNSRTRIVVVTIGVVFSSLAALLAFLATTFASSVIMSISFGIGLGLSNTVVITLLTDLFGCERIARLHAITNLLSGLLVLVSPPFAGWLYDTTLNYYIPYLFCGLMGMVGAAFFLAILLTNKKMVTRKLLET